MCRTFFSLPAGRWNRDPAGAAVRTPVVPNPPALKKPLLLIVLALVAFLARGVYLRLGELDQAAGASRERLPVPVEVAAVQRGPITLRRTFSGALEATAEFTAAPKVGGRLERLAVDLGDSVSRGQVLAWLDDAEYQQAVQQAEAELAVARASHAEAESALQIAERALARAEALRGEGVTSESQTDLARADQLAAQAQLEVASARITRAESQLETARIRLGYTRVSADWSGGDDERVVSQRWVDEGTTVSANAPLMSVVELDPILAVVFVPERDYARLGMDMAASLVIDSYPDLVFEGRVARISPVFRRTTRQARVEILVDNSDERLKPGMFARAVIDMAEVEEATILPFAALTERDGMEGVFVVSSDGDSVHWRVVEAGIREGDRVQVLDGDLRGRVVVLGQELCDDGCAITIPDDLRGAGEGDAPALQVPAR